MAEPTSTPPPAGASVEMALGRCIENLNHLVGRLQGASLALEDMDVPTAHENLVVAHRQVTGALEALMQAHDAAPSFTPAGWLLTVNRLQVDCGTVARALNGMGVASPVAHKYELADDVDALEVQARLMCHTVRGLLIEWNEPLHPPAESVQAPQIETPSVTTTIIVDLCDRSVFCVEDKGHEGPCTPSKYDRGGRHV